MDFSQLPGLDKPVSKIVFGAIHLTPDKREAGFAILNAACEHGINTFDAGHVYGGGGVERTLGDWITARGNRDEVVVISKCSHHNADRKRVTPFDISSDLFDSLARLKTDCIDIYLFHRDDPDVPVAPLVEAMNEHINAGRIKCYGGSNWSAPRIAEANAYAAKNGLAPMVLSSPNFSLAHQVDSPWGDDCLTLSGDENEAARAWHTKSKVPVFAWSSLARGFLSGRISRANFDAVKDDFEEHTIRCYAVEENFQRLDRLAELAPEKGLTVAQLAIAWVLAQPFPVHALVGAMTSDEIKQVVDILAVDLTAAESRWLDLKSDAR